MLFCSVSKSIGVLFLSCLGIKTTGAKVKWLPICKPKEEGGLRFKVVREWKNASMSRHLWAVCQKADTLSVKWIHTSVIENHCFWTMNTPCNASWTLKQKIILRPIATSWIKNVVGNGLDNFLRLDNWHPPDSLYQRHGDTKLEM